MKFLTKGEKLKSTRKYLKMKQEDLTDENLTRGLISMIEIGKRELSNKVALKLVEKFEQRAKELHIELKIDNGFLLRSPSEDAELYCMEKLEQIKQDKDIKEILEIANKFNLLNVKALGYSRLGDYCSNKKNYDEAFINYIYAIDIFKNLKQNETIPYIYFKIGYCKAKALQYAEALSFFYLSQRYSIMYNDKKTEKRSIYDIAKCYMKLNKINLALENIEKFLILCNKEEDYNSYIYANILKANCFEAREEFNTAIDIYDSLLIENIDCNNPVLGYIYNNLGLAYLDKNDFNNSLEYFNKAEQLRIKINSANICHTIIEKSSVFIKQGFYNDAITYIESGLKLAEDNMDYEYLIKGNYELVRIYEILNDVLNLKKTYLNIADFLKIINKYSELVSVYTKLSIIYLNENNVEDAKEYLLMSLKQMQNVAL
ncbi:helix-turn-helix domain-containing protein [Clostridium algoriphilum]|uniref:helix-turn-helix domain-containing protein n=1 Tax=Clostridium algoriphilum TaxID=198347 RepID=UPI001CF5DB1F|nr:helix-turn-helix transcriptional regulator [Clostridium algoriphilum]MCB2293566.1 helix-turn-helix domain-containing protein [Clostridium algoriphilum]